MNLKAKFIFVEWVDAAVLGNWATTDDSGVETCFAAGFLVKETDIDITVAAAVSEHQINAAISIPKAWIKKRKVLKF